MPVTRRLDGIQWLRAIAAGLVVVEHSRNAISSAYLGLAPADSPLSLFPFSAGVDLFFVISGFIMAYSSAPLFGREGGWRIFLLRRTARIVPLYWLTTSFMLAVFMALGSPAWSSASWASIIASYAFLPAPNADGRPFPLFVIGWTLNYEMAFYAVFALFIGLRERTALWLTVATVVAVAALGLLLAPASLPLRFWSNPIILEFAAGIGLYALYRAGVLRFAGPVRFALAALAIGVLALHPDDPGLWRALVWGGPAMLLVAMALAWSETSRSVATSSRADFAGDLSYAVYLAHLPVVLTVEAALPAFLPAAGWVWFGVFPALVAGGTLACAVLLHILIERPVLRAARRVSLPPPTETGIRTPLPSSATGASPN
jgi:peptidoglycan/LPS O-acetylase OafA/YrhL